LLLRRLAGDDMLRRQFSRYQLISDALRDHLPEQVTPDFHLRVQAALRDEAVPAAAPARVNLAAFVKPAAGVAIAASVAVVAVLSLQGVRQADPQSATPTVASAPAATDYIRAEGQPPPAAASRPARDLDAYLVNHHEIAVNRGMRGMLPYVQIVGQGDRSGGQQDAE
jgi:sigma-E factor negative regulatory protein RseA